MSEDFNMVAPKKVLIMTRVPLIIQLPWNQTQKLGSKPNLCKNPQITRFCSKKWGWNNFMMGWKSGEMREKVEKTLSNG